MPILALPRIGSGMHEVSSEHASGNDAGVEEVGAWWHASAPPETVCPVSSGAVSHFPPPGQDIRQVTHAGITARESVSVMPAQGTPYTVGYVCTSTVSC